MEITYTIHDSEGDKVYVRRMRQDDGDELGGIAIEYANNTLLFRVQEAEDLAKAINLAIIQPS